MIHQFHDMALLADFMISDNQGQSPEGYLICYNVPVARVGVQEYLGSEFNFHDRPNEIIKVHRLPEDVFEPESMRSGEAKSVTDDHPPVKAVHITNHKQYNKGHAQNVRRSTDFLMMDLVVTDETLIQKIKNGKREVSLGYECELVPFDNDLKQVNIRINHVAIVDRARAGRKAAIRDSVPSGERKPMSLAETKAAIFAAYVKDASPSPKELAEAMTLLGVEAPKQESEASLVSKLLAGLKFSAKDESAEEQKKEDTEMAALKEEVKGLKDAISGLLNAGEAKEIGDEDETEMLEDEDETEEEVVATDDDATKEDVKDSDILAAVKKSMAKMNAKDQAILKASLAPFMGRTTSSEKTAKIRKIADSHAQKGNSKLPPVQDVGRMIAERYNHHAKAEKPLFG